MNWIDNNGKIISCIEKIKLLNENLEELKKLNLNFDALKQTQEFKDALEDAMLLNVSEQNFISKINKEIYKKTLENKFIKII